MSPELRLGHPDLGFGLGPRLNAAGRLADMSLGIECLLTDDYDRAMSIAAELDGMNRERREIEADMRLQAELKLDELISREIALAEVNDAFAAMESGEVARSVIRF